MQKVAIFGSVPEDRATAFSDVDVLIVISDTKKRFIERADEFRSYFDGLGMECDIFVYTEDEVENTPLAKKALSGGTLHFTRK